MFEMMRKTKIDVIYVRCVGYEKRMGNALPCKEEKSGNHFCPEKRYPGLRGSEPLHLLTANSRASPCAGP
jgi:hypothetical protein